MRDSQFEPQFDAASFPLAQIEHRYGSGVHLLADTFLQSHLARLCAEDTTQPFINELITTLYSSLLKIVVNREFPVQRSNIRTRMAASHPHEAVLEVPVINPETPIVSVNLARAGTVPSHVCYSALNYFMNPVRVRQDHISIARTTDTQDRVTGSQVSGHKIGGTVKDGIVLFPDPMGATGSTIVEAVDLYKKSEAATGKARKYIAIHCIVTPEYLKRVKAAHPDLSIYAIRLDRGLSPDSILSTVPGTHWDQERGLNEKHYIVPGGGGFGEILNNAYA